MREIEYIINEQKYPNPLPKDGVPRLTLDGYRILKAGMKGDFSEWAEQIGNHPLTLPPNVTRNLKISCDKENNHFKVSFWYGELYPIIDDCLCLGPSINFDIIQEWPLESHRGKDEKLEYIKLGQSSDCWGWVDGIIILIDDFGTDTRHERTLYRTWRGRYGDDYIDYDQPEKEPLTKPVKKPVKTVSLFDFEDVRA